MKKRENFTVGRVAAFECEPGKKQSFFWDGKTPGLGVRVTPGSKAYIFETRLAGKTMRITIGDVRTWALGDAQIEARELKSMTDKGIDPRQVKAAVIAEAEAQRVATEAQREEAKEQREVARLAQAPALDAWNAYIKARQRKWGDKHRACHIKLSSPGGLPRSRGRRAGDSDVTLPGILLPLLNLRPKLSPWSIRARRCWSRRRPASRTRMSLPCPRPKKWGWPRLSAMGICGW